MPSLSSVELTVAIGHATNAENRRGFNAAPGFEAHWQKCARTVGKLLGESFEHLARVIRKVQVAHFVGVDRNHLKRFAVLPDGRRTNL